MRVDDIVMSLIKKKKLLYNWCYIMYYNEETIESTKKKNIQIFSPSSFLE